MSKKPKFRTALRNFFKNKGLDEVYLTGKSFYGNSGVRHTYILTGTRYGIHLKIEVHKDLTRNWSGTRTEALIIREDGKEVPITLTLAKNLVS